MNKDRPNNASHSSAHKASAAVGLLLITLIVVGAIVVFRPNETTSTAVATQTPMKSQSSSAQSGVSYKDGTYTETGSYGSPAGTESISVTLTLSGDTVSDASVTRQANDPTASSYQGLFISGYKGMVVGKKLSEINLTNVSGSSLTPQGFMNALTKIETDARA